MIAKVILGTMTNARKLVSIAERISCDLPPNKKTWESPVKSMFSEARNTM